jgi:L-alanine-DL-glutamate epimerase-like enolase superfamily enzyme
MAAKPIKIRRASATVEREPLLRPFGFKGAYVSELWQTVVLLEGEAGGRAVGLGTQSVLWSDPHVFASHSEADGNALMLAVTKRALQMAQEVAFRDPIELLDALLPRVFAYAQQITGRPQLRRTFALNALVGLDNAAWLLYRQATRVRGFDAMIPEPYRPALSHRHERVACIPVVGYGVPVEEIEQAARQGFFCFKVKLGHPGSQEEMLEKDTQRLDAIHRVLGPLRTEYTATGAVPYYFDANGRYERKETLLRLLDHADKIGALDRIAILEEPFPETYKADVDDLGVCIAADESAHTDADALACIERGYGALALKPVAKTLSMTLKIARIAAERGVPCFCADLTVNPILVDWNKMVAARLAPFPGFGLGLLETNGHQQYRNWATMTGYHPHAGASWTTAQDGVFRLNDDFYEHHGGIFDLPRHYLTLAEHA